MSQFNTWYRSQPTALRGLITINVVLYVLWQLPLRFIAPVAQFVEGHLALHPALPGILLEPWQLVTYNFLHLGTGFGGLLHVGFNMLWLYWIGKEYEQMHGAHEITALYLIGGVGGGLFTVVVYAVLGSNAIIYGASASVLAVMMAVAVLYPYKKIGLFLIGVVPLLYVVLGFLALDLLFLGSSNTAVAAHMGGALTGFLFARAQRRGLDLTSWAGVFFVRRGRSGGRSSARGASRGASPNSSSSEEEETGGGLRAWFGRRGPSKDERKPGQTLREDRKQRNAEQNAAEAEIDRILEKISEHGYEALSDEEKRILYEASQR